MPFHISLTKMAKEKDVEIIYYIMKLLGCLRIFSKETFNMENINHKRHLMLLA